MKNALKTLKYRFLNAYFYSPFLQRLFTVCDVCGRIRTSNSVKNRTYYGIPGLSGGPSVSMRSKNRMCGRCHRGMLNALKTQQIQC